MTLKSNMSYRSVLPLDSTEISKLIRSTKKSDL